MAPRPGSVSLQHGRASRAPALWDCLPSARTPQPSHSDIWWLSGGEPKAAQVHPVSKEPRGWIRRPGQAQEAPEGQPGSPHTVGWGLVDKGREAVATALANRG